MHRFGGVGRAAWTTVALAGVVALTQTLGACLLHWLELPAGLVVAIPLNFVLVVGVVFWLRRIGDASEEDPLTHVYNRRGYDRRFDEEINRLARPSDRLVLALLDLDHFKRVNDVQGHAAGDRMLVECTAAWSQELPARASLCRFGGDEFALLLPGMTLTEAKGVVELMSALTPDGLSVSAGIAEWTTGSTRSDLFTHADLALYAAKGAGRDRCVVFEEGIGQAAAPAETPRRSALSARLANQPSRRQPVRD